MHARFVLMTLPPLTRTADTDQVTMGPKLVIKDQSIGVANQADDMNGMDGILGKS
jgi:hypothetical protein